MYLLTKRLQEILSDNVAREFFNIFQVIYVYVWRVWG